MKSLVVYKINGDIPTILASELESAQFHECGELDMSRQGFSLNVQQEFASDLSGMQVMSYTTQQKKPKKSEIDKRVKVLTSTYEEEFGAPPAKHEVGEMTDNIIMELLPLTFADEPKHFTMFIYGQYLYVEGGYKLAEEATAHLRKVLGSLPIQLVETAKDTTDELTRFVGKSISDNLTLKDKCTMVTQEERKITVAKSLYHSEAQDIVDQGAKVTSVEMEFDGVVKFTLKDDLSFTGVKFYDDLISEVEEGDEIGTTIIKLREVVKMVDEVIYEMGGLLGVGN